MMDNTNKLRYITEIPRLYHPHIYKPRNLLTKFLRAKHIINLSNYEPSPTEIEVLALNLNFITNQPLPEDITSEAIQTYIEKIDRRIYFHDSQNRPLQGHISRLFKEPWVAPPDDWQYDQSIIQKLEELRNSINNPDVTTNAFPKPLLEAIHSLRTNPDIYITKADKGGATVIWAVEDYTREALRQLSDTSTYEEIPSSKVQLIIKDLNDKKHELSDWLYHYQRITKRERELILKSTSTLPPIYFLPKIHKSPNTISKTFPGRPIVATFNCHLHWFDKYITEITNKLHHLIPHALIDTLHLLDKLQNRQDKLPKGLRILSADVQNLYPSIDWEIGIEAATSTFTKFHDLLIKDAEDNHRLKPPSPPMFRTLLSYILKNSYMHFQNKQYFHQTRGTAMGMCISVFFARAFMLEMIRPIRDNPPTHLHCLEIFIDDIFVASTGTNDEISNMMLSISSPTIKYTFDPPSNECIMLDLTITIDNDKFITRNYSKPTASPFYLHAASMHPPSTIRSIPYAQLLRIRRNSTFLNDFFEPAKKILRTFKLRGYPKQILDEAFTKAISVPRYRTLERNAASKSIAIQNSIKFILPYNYTTDYKSTRIILSDLHRKVKEFYKNTPTEDALNGFEVALVHSNLNTIDSSFSTQYKKGKLPAK